MTIHQENVGAKKDSGVVGFAEHPHAQYLVFPKSLRRFDGRRVIGIKYELLAKGSRPGVKPPREEEREPAWQRMAKKPARNMREQSAKRATVIPFTTESKAHAPEPVEKARFSENVRKVETSPSRDASPKIDRAVIAEIKKAIKELRAGKAVPAYERLERIVAQAEST